MQVRYETLDGNEAVARVAHTINEVIAIYPITPASPIGEWADVYSAQGATNLWGNIPDVIEMQSEGGAAGAVHGALQSGSLTTTFTASQGLLLMLPNMYKIAGELTATVFHVAARSVASQALSIFGDHSDVMAVRQSGFAFLASSSVQEVHDFALIAQAASLESRIPFLHFFDGFRTSHEISKIALLEHDVMRHMLDDTLIKAHRERGLSPDHPSIRGTAQNPDVFFQGRESVNPYYEATADIVDAAFKKFAQLTGRTYQPFEYYGAADATRIIIIMGSAAQTTLETVDYLNQQGEKVGLIKVTLFRPFSIKHFVAVLPQSVHAIAVLDRTKEPGSLGEPLYEDVVTTFTELIQDKKSPLSTMPTIIGGRYGLSSKEFTPAMVKAIFDELSKPQPKNHFTIGIYDDVTHHSLEWDEKFIIEDPKIFSALFFGLGSDGTVGANKNSIKIIGEIPQKYVQGYFVYDSKKSGSMTVSHLRFGDHPIRSSYLIDKADFIACHQTVFLEKFDILSSAKEGGVFLLNTPFTGNEAWAYLPKVIQEEIIVKKLQVYAINAYEVAQANNLGRRINTIMQACFFAISGVLEKEESIQRIKHFIKKTYRKQGDNVINDNFNAVDASLKALYHLTIPKTAESTLTLRHAVSSDAPAFVQSVTAKLIAGQGDLLPVSQIPADGTWPTGTTQYEKRTISQEIPVWESDLCTQCNSCVTVCPHAVIRSKVYDASILDNAPASFKSVAAKGKNFAPNERFTIQIAPQDCTGCSLCTEVCPAHHKDLDIKAINMRSIHPILDQEIINWDFFKAIPDIKRDRLNHSKVKEAQLLRPLFEFSGACPGCGETPYIKLATQLFGDRMLVANATGCSSIYGGNLPTTPWAKNDEGLGPAWSNSLFEDNAEFGLGFRLSVDFHTKQAKELLKSLSTSLNYTLVDPILNAVQEDETAIFQQRERVAKLKEELAGHKDEMSQRLLSLADYLVKKSIWIIGGDGWAYDIGYGGLDHVLASGKNVNILVLDTQVYSNTGGQQSKATPTGAVAKFAAKGKAGTAKDLALMALAYKDVYVARVAMGANEHQTLKAMLEAEAYNGPSIIIAYSHCIAHGYDLKYGMQQQDLAVKSGLWPIFRYNPALIEANKNPFSLDCKKPSIEVEAYMKNEARFTATHVTNPEQETAFIMQAQEHANALYEHYETLQSSYEPQPSS